MSEQVINIKGYFKWGFIAVIALVLVISAGSLLETTDAQEYKMLQRAVTGTLVPQMQAGTFLQMFGNVTTFDRAGTVWFSSSAAEGGDGPTVGPVEIRFNDGGTAKVNGSVRYALSSNGEFLKEIKRRYGTDENLQHAGITQVVNEAIILTGALMNSEESYTARAQFSEMARDQIINGVYLTESKVQEIQDPLTGDVKEVRTVTVKIDTLTNQPMRKPNPLAIYGVKFSQCVIKEIDYEPGVLQLIEKKREYLMKIAAKRAEAENAIQERKTATEIGKKNVTEKEYAALVLKKEATINAEKDKAVAETQAQKKLEVAKLDKEAAAQEKQANILRGQGEAERKRLVLQADGALEKKLAAYVEVQKAYADAFAKRQVPMWNQGASNGQGTDSDVSNFESLISAYVLKDMGLDMTMKKGATAGK